MSTINTTNLKNPSSATNNIVLNADGTVTILGNTRGLTLGTSQNSTSGTSIDFTSIPSWVKRITVMFNGVSLNGTALVICQIGAGSFKTTGYDSYVNSFDSGPGGSTFTNGFGLGENTVNACVYHGHIMMTKLSDHNWTASVMLATTGSAVMSFGAGSVSLAGSLDRLRITTTSSTTGSTFNVDTFDAGTINILYE
jgi:hypothetical protein